MEATKPMHGLRDSVEVSIRSRPEGREIHVTVVPLRKVSMRRPEGREILAHLPQSSSFNPLSPRRTRDTLIY